MHRKQRAEAMPKDRERETESRARAPASAQAAEKPGSAAYQARLARALRANLRKRKTQSRRRGADAVEP